jgi:hypothetical protein
MIIGSGIPISYYERLWHCRGNPGCGPFGGSVAKTTQKISYDEYRYPPEIIQQAIWLYLRFTLSFRDDLLAERRSQRTCISAAPSLTRYGIWMKSI